MKLSPLLFRIRPTSFVALGAFVWLFIFITSVISTPTQLTLEELCRTLALPLTACLLYYFNFYVLIPYIKDRRRFWLFLLVNVCIILLLCLMSLAIFRFFPPPGPTPNGMPPAGRYIDRGVLFTLMRDGLLYAFVVLGATFLRSAASWYQNATKLSQALIDRQEAEIQQLKFQINPHFLFNTLNALYMLAPIDGEKTQKAIMELSKMMRYMLSTLNQNFVPVKSEAELIQSYISLMKLRMPAKFHIEAHFCPSLWEGDATMTPMVLISLVENAFKYGRSFGDEGYVKISFCIEDGEVRFKCINSYYGDASKASHSLGIGLSNVKRRLDFAYPAGYFYEYGFIDDGKAYQVEIRLNG